MTEYSEFTRYCKVRSSSMLNCKFLCFLNREKQTRGRQESLEINAGSLLSAECKQMVSRRK